MLKQVQHDSLIKTKNAFTLAEVLIAVVIIGTLATLTIATYMTTSTSWNNQYVAGLKKVYSELSYATDRIKANNSGTLIAALSGTHEARDLFCTTLKCSKICEAGSIQDNCWANSTLKLSGGVPVESFDPEVVKANLLNTSPSVAMKAVELIRARIAFSESSFAELLLCRLPKPLDLS